MSWPASSLTYCTPAQPHKARQLGPLHTLPRSLPRPSDPPSRHPRCLSRPRLFVASVPAIGPHLPNPSSPSVRPRDPPASCPRVAQIPIVIAPLVHPHPRPTSTPASSISISPLHHPASAPALPPPPSPVPLLPRPFPISAPQRPPPLSNPTSFPASYAGDSSPRLASPFCVAFWNKGGPCAAYEYPSAYVRRAASAHARTHHHPTPARAPSPFPPSRTHIPAARSSPAPRLSPLASRLSTLNNSNAIHPRASTSARKSQIGAQSASPRAARPRSPQARKPAQIWCKSSHNLAQSRTISLNPRRISGASILCDAPCGSPAPPRSASRSRSWSPSRLASSPASLRISASFELSPLAVAQRLYTITSTRDGPRAPISVSSRAPSLVKRYTNSGAGRGSLEAGEVASLGFDGDGPAFALVFLHPVGSGFRAFDDDAPHPTRTNTHKGTGEDDAGVQARLLWALSYRVVIADLIARWTPDEHSSTRPCPSRSEAGKGACGAWAHRVRWRLSMRSRPTAATIGHGAPGEGARTACWQGSDLGLLGWRSRARRFFACAGADLHWARWLRRSRSSRTCAPSALLTRIGLVSMTTVGGPGLGHAPRSLVASVSPVEASARAACAG
ncbi:hypothetical protein HETIRDRAFT_447464 [Heterobasidion irregulare TC 32-1]|uniref:Uncharacterized protein n=1 Tax=Heterobasidion irregulare (strain TC 32-1) TaxID=747525 RepID=W4KLU8_HETIT|nr:uncharacterized protein HETIRDRAFT_447464 [Heterobasidion irregulare TC 32-1]ETW86803.1 hypothetical protein HETIRDRAFT_447464 [Heterobasidion irregulare TC 32-1]